MGIVLSIISILMSLVLFPFSFAYTIVRLTIKANIKAWAKHIDKLFFSIAISIDQLGNVVCQHLFNDALIKKDGYKFGACDDTVSYVLGANKELKTLTILGLWFCDMLHFFDKNHVEKTFNNGQKK